MHDPNGHVPHLLATAEGVLVGLHRGRSGDAVIVGAPGEPMRSIPVNRLKVQRDGGTVIAMTNEGILDIPSRRLASGPKVPTWQGTALTAVEPRDYDIDLTGTPTISPKGAAPGP